MTTRRQFLGSSGSLALLALTGLPAVAQAAESTVRFAIAKAAGDMDPHVYKGLWGIQDLMYEPLVGYGPGGTLFPVLAESWDLEEDGRLLRFRLRQGVTFHDGAPWNAAAMKWNLDRWITLEAHSWINHARLFDGLTILDDHTVEMRFREPPLALMYEMTYVRPVRFLSPTSVAADGAYKTPVGTGPWQQVSATDVESVFEAFPGYWGDKPSFNRLEMKVLPDSRSRMTALRAGEIDVIGGDFLSPVTANEAQALADAGVAVSIEPGTSIMLGFNTERTPALADARVRRAISIGFDRQAISTVLYNGYATPAGSMFPPGTPLTGEPYPAEARDADAARALLEEAGWTGDGIRQKDGVPLQMELVVSEEQIAASRSMGEVIQAQLGEIGIGITVRSVDHASRHSDIPERKFDLAFFRTFGAPYDPYGTMIGYLLSTYENGVDGKLVINVEELDPLMTAAFAATADEAEAKLQVVFEWMRDTSAFAPVMYLPSIWAHGPRVATFTPPATPYDTPYEGLTLTAS